MSLAFEIDEIATVGTFISSVVIEAPEYSTSVIAPDLVSVGTLVVMVLLSSDTVNSLVTPPGNIIVSTVWRFVPVIWICCPKSGVVVLRPA